MPLKTKTATEVISAFQQIFASTDRRPIRLQTDKGREFNNHNFIGFLKKNNIKYNTVANDTSHCCQAERFIKTLKSKLFKILDYKNSSTYVNFLSDILDAYNNTVHSSTKFAPANVKPTDVLEVYNNLTKNHKRKLVKPKYKIGDNIRISKNRVAFLKSYRTNYSDEIFKIKTVLYRHPVVYRISDLADEDIEGIFYEKELQKVLIDKETVFPIDKILKTKRVGRSLKLFVKWRGYPDKFNSWINSKVLK